MYFHFEADEDFKYDAKLKTKQCAYVKQNNRLCRNRITIGIPFCWLHSKYELNIVKKKSLIPNAGVGLFSFDNEKGNNEIVFKNNEYICPYAGEIINTETLEDRYDEYTAPYAVYVKINKYSDAAKNRGIGSLINHSPRKVNCKIAVSHRYNTINIVATKDIKNNKELYLDYGEDYKLTERGVKSSTNRNKYKL